MSTTSETALDEVRQFFVSHQVGTSKRILVAFSGGCDSLALAILLSRLFPHEHLHALYVNHRLRTELELGEEERLNAKNCNSVGIPFSIVRLDGGAVDGLSLARGNGIEDAARTLRYQVLEQKRIELGFDHIATAHTFDDQAETMLMRLLQGSGPSALQGIAPEQGVVLRPLLRVTRSMIEEVVSEYGLTASEDSTNADTHFLRNSIRHELVPHVARLFPRYREALDQVAMRNREVVRCLSPAVDAAIVELVTRSEDSVVCDLTAIGTYDRYVLEQVVYHMWSLLPTREGRRLPYRQVDSIVERLVKGGSDGERMVLADTTLEFETERLVWSNGLPALAEGYLSFVYSDQVELDGSHRLILGGAPISSVPVEKRARIDGATLAPPVVVRSYREGDTISLVEGTKKVGSLFSDWHIRRSQRWRIPVVEDTVGVCAVLGGAFGGSDRVATRCLGTALARNGGTLYSVVELEG